MKYIFILTGLLLSFPLYGQDISVTASGPSSQNDIQTFSFENAELRIQGNDLVVRNSGEPAFLPQVVSFNRSKGLKMLGAIHRDYSLHTVLFDGKGNRVNKVTMDYFDPDDETVALKVFDDGSFITRDNVANFTFFDAEGSVRFNVSNSSGSQDGESVSEWNADPSGNTVLLYNPRINYGDQSGSRARIVKGEELFTHLYSSRQRTIKDTWVSESGSFVILITEQSGEDDRVHIYDHMGNTLQEFDSDEELMGAVLSEKAEYVTVFSSSRAQVYRLSDLERLGSTSFRVRVIHAEYIPADQQIVALCGVLDSNLQVSGPEIHSVHLGHRSIARADVQMPLSVIPDGHVTIRRVERGQFLVDGLNRRLQISTRF